MNLGFGYSRGVPEDVHTAWGARLIAPDDLVHDRQDLVAENDEAKAELIAWLNGGAIRRALDNLRPLYGRTVLGNEDREHVIYEDDDGVIIGNTNASYGYVYLAGWLHLEDRRALREIRRATVPGRAHDALTVDHYEAVRAAVPEERWVTKYGWTPEEAVRMADTGEEVRLYAVYSGGHRREILPNKRSGEFEFGYHGSGPHALAEAIVNDRRGIENDAADTDTTYVPPARAFEFVPEVTTVRERADDNRAKYETLSISAVYVDARMTRAAVEA